MTGEAVAQVLLDIDLGHLVGVLVHQEHIDDLDKLKALSDNTMRDLGIPDKDQRKLRLWAEACKIFDRVSDDREEVDLQGLQMAFAALDLGQSMAATEAMLQRADTGETKTVNFLVFIKLVMDRNDSISGLPIAPIKPPEPAPSSSSSSAAEPDDEMYWLPDEDDIFNTDFLTSEEDIESVAKYADDDKFASVPDLGVCNGEACKASFLFVVVNPELLQGIAQKLCEVMIESFKTDLNNALGDADLPQMEEVASGEQIEAIANGAYETFTTMAHRFCHEHPFTNKPTESLMNEMNRFRVRALFWASKQFVVAYETVFVEALQNHLEGIARRRQGGFWRNLLLIIGGGFLLTFLGLDPTWLAGLPDGVTDVVTSDMMQETMQDFIARTSGQ